MVKALALEVGDSPWDEDHVPLGEALVEDFPGALPAEDEKKMATVMRYAFELRGKNIEDEEEDL